MLLLLLLLLLLLFMVCSREVLLFPVWWLSVVEQQCHPTADSGEGSEASILHFSDFRFSILNLLDIVNPNQQPPPVSHQSFRLARDSEHNQVHWAGLKAKPFSSSHMMSHLKPCHSESH
jgi:hypothetical protein